jgi:methionyl-tRNA formyltransferase
VIAADAAQFTVRCDEGAIKVLQVHPDGKRPMPVADFLRGRPIHVGDRFE